MKVDGTIAFVVLPVHMKRDLPAAGRFVIAERLVEHVRARLAALPELRAVPEDGVPPVATKG